MKKNKAIKLLMLIAIILGITAIPTFAKAVPSLDEFKVNRRWYCLRRDGYYSNTGLTNAGEITVNGKNIIGNNFNINNKKLTKDQLYKIAYILTEAKANGAKRISANGFSYQQAIWKILGQNISEDKKDVADGNPSMITLNKAADDYKKAVDNGLGSKEIIKDIITDEAILLESGEYGPFYVTYDANIAYKTPKIIIEGGTKKGEKSTTQDGITTVKFNIKPNNSSVTKVKIKVTAEGIRKASFNIYNPNEYNENDSKLTTTGAKFYVANGIQCYYCREDYKAGHPQNVFLCVNTGKLVYIPNGFNVAFYCHACGNTDDNVNIHQSLANNAQGYFHTCSQNDKKTYQVVKYGGDYWSIRTNTEIYHIGARNQAHLMTKCRWIRTGKQPLLESLERKSQINKESKEKEYDLIPPVNLTLDKVNSLDLEGDELYNIPNIPFNIKFEQDGKQIYNKDVTTGKDGKVKIEKVIPNSRNDITVTITEKKDVEGDGYKVLSEPLVITLQCIDGKYWKEKDGAGKLSGGEKYVVNYNTNATIGLTVKLENKSIIEKLTLLKTSSVGGGKVEKAKFKLTLTNVASIKNHQIPEAGEVTIIETTNSDGNLVLEDIEIKNLNEPVVITIEEIEAPVGYKKIEGTITVTLKRKGNTYTIHKAEKEDTVTDDEFKAGEVTLKNHELELDIQDIPVMNLGGIVWTEKIQTGKEQPEINNQYDGENQDEALGGVEVRLLDGNNNVIATTTTAKQDGEKVTYLNNLGKEVTVELKQGQYLFTKLNKLNNGTNYIPVRTDYKVEIDYDGITYNSLINPDTSMLYKNKEDNKGVFSKITSEDDHGLADGTKTISGTENEKQSKTNDGYTINYILQDEKNIPDKAIYSNVEKDGDQVFVTARSEKYLQKTDDWKTTWKGNNGVGEINLDSYAFDINFGLYKKFFDLNLGTDVDSAEIEINGQKTAYTYDQILDGMLDKDLREKLYKTTDDKVDYNLYLAYSDYYYRIDDYKVPGSTDSLGQPYGEALPGKKDENTELQVYVTYTLQINNQSTQHNATGVKVKYSYDDGYEYVGSNGEATVSDEGHNILTISNINNVVPGEKPKEITLKFKVKKNEDGTFFKAPSDTSKYTNVAEIVEYSTTEGRLVDADSAPGNTFLGENNPTDRREDDTDTANGIVIRFKENAERSISGKVFEDSDKNSTQNGEEQAVNDVIVQLIELVEINNKQYEYIWQETVAGSNTVKTTDRNGYSGKIYEYKKSDDENPSGKMVEQEINGETGYCIYVDGTNSDGQYKFVNIIPGNYIVRFIYGDGSTYDIKEDTLKYNGEDYKSTYVDYKYNAEWYNTNTLDGVNSKAVDNEARRLKVLSYAVDVDGNKGKTLNALNNITDTSKQAEIINAYKNLKKIGEAEAVQWNDVQKDVLANTWMCAETLKIKVPVDPSVLVNENGEKEEKLSITENSTSVKKADSQYKVTFDNVNLGLMERPKTKLVLEKHITGLTVKPVASGVNLIANATADINKILDQGEGDQIQLEGQRDGLSATKSGRTNRGLWYLQTDTTELAQGADAYITYTYVIKNEGDGDYLNNVLVDLYEKLNADEYKQKLEEFEAGVKNAKKDSTSEEYKKGQQYKNGTYISDFYYTGTKGENDKEVLASVEQIQEALNPKVKFVNSTTDFNIIKNQDGSTLVENKNVYKEDGTGITEEEIKEQIESTKGTGKMKLNGRDTSKKLVVSVGLSASEIENDGVYDSYIAQVTHYTNAAGRRDQSTPANLSYVHSYDTNKTLKDYNEEDEFWAETFRITKPTGEDKITPVQIAIITISAVAVLGVGIILIKKFVLKK